MSTRDATAVALVTVCGLLLLDPAIASGPAGLRGILIGLIGGAAYIVCVEE